MAVLCLGRCHLLVRVTVRVKSACCMFRLGLGLVLGLGSSFRFFKVEVGVKAKCLLFV